jgi:hypothetical protein
MILFSVLALLLITMLTVNEFYQWRLDVPCTPSLPRVQKRMLTLAAGDSSGKIVEFGSGWGGLSFRAARLYPQREITGLELSLCPYLFSRLRQKLSRGLKNLTFVRQDFTTFPLQDTAVVLCYLTNPLMASLRSKFLHDLPKGAVVISSTFFIPRWQPETTEHIRGLWDTPIFLYRRGQGEET